METTSKIFTWNGIDLNALRQVMDEPADQAVMSIYNSNAMTELRNLLISMASNDSPVSDTLPKEMRDFVTSELAYPFTQEDISYFNQTQEIWKKEGMKFVFILMFRALPYTYMAEKPANVLRMTKLLVEQPERRIFETAQFVFDVMDNNWWEPGKRGLLTALKVRIMHASMRHLLLTNTDGEVWNNDWGKPISQEDLIATNQVFSLEFFKGLTMLGTNLTDAEQKAWFHTWTTIGKIMGIRQELIAKDVKEAWDLQHTIYDHLFNDPTHAGIPLAKALVGTMVHFHLPEKLTLLLMKRMLADEQFPDCFQRMLGPTYQQTYPELFHQPTTAEEKEQHRKLLNEHFRIQLNTYYEAMKGIKIHFEFKTENKLIIRFINWLKRILGMAEKKEHLFITHLSLLHQLLHKDGTDTPVEELEEDTILAFISLLGGLMVSFLSVYFREGKNSGFRIPVDLQELWSLK